MNIPFVDLKVQYNSIKESIDGAIHEVLNATSFVGGTYVQAFEASFAAALGVKHCIGVGNGTDAIYITLKMLGIGVGDEVITPATSWISTSETISQTGATPVFVDIDPITYTVDVHKLQEKISSRTKAILAVHLYGHAAEIRTIGKIAVSNNLFLVEDCAQAHFTEDAGQHVGTFGIASTFSFYPGKNLGAYGDAGAVVTNNDALAEKIRLYANHGGRIKHQHVMEGVNSRLDSLQAAILSVKLPYLTKWTSQRIANAAHYTRLLTDVEQITLPTVRSSTVHTFHLYVIRTKKRDQLKEYLQEKGVQTGIHYPCALPNLPAYSYLNHQPAEFPIASAYQNDILSLPMYPELTIEQIEYIVSAIKKFFGH